MSTRFKMKSLFDRKAKQHQFSPEDQVMVVGSPFQLRFAGPCTVKWKVSEQDYMVTMPKGKSRLCRVNLLKSYYTRTSRA